MGWKEDINSWAERNSRNANKVEEIAKTKGWEPEKYQDSMRSSLYDFLDKWYTLSVKTLPEPATKSVNRRNPIISKTRGYQYTKLSNNWRIWTIQNDDKYSVIASNNNRYIEYANNNLNSSIKIHQHLVKQLRKNNG